MKKEKFDFLSWLVFVVLAIIWGSSFMLMKKSLVVFSNIQLATLRISIAGLVFLPVLYFNFKKLPITKIKYAALVGVVGSFLPALCFSTAQQHLDSFVAGILNSLTPFFTVLCAVVFFKENIKINKIIGVAIGFCGALIMATNRGGAAAISSINSYALLTIVATFFYGLNANFVKHYTNNIAPYTLNAFALGIMMAPCLLILNFTDFLVVMQTNPDAGRALMYVAILGVLGTGVAGYLYFWLIQRRGVIFGVMVTYIMPIIALFWGVLDNESIHSSHIISFAIIVLGVYIVNRNNEC